MELKFDALNCGAATVEGCTPKSRFSGWKSRSTIRCKKTLQVHFYNLVCGIAVAKFRCHTLSFTGIL